MAKTFSQDNKATRLLNNYFHLCDPDLEIMSQQKGMDECCPCLEIVIYHNFIKLNHISLNKEENPINKNVDEKIKIIINKKIDEKIKTIDGSLFLKHQKHALFKVPWCKENINTQRTFFLFSG